VNSVRKTHHVVVVEEDWRHCGMGDEIVASLQEAAFDYLDAPMLRVTADDEPTPYSKTLERAALPDETRVMRAVKQVLARLSPQEAEQVAQAAQVEAGRTSAEQAEQEEEEEEEIEA
jgi:hypothetical protein